MSSVIKIEKLSESTLRVYSDDFGIENELADYFSFYAPNYRFMPKFKAKIWDGKIRQYDVHRKTLPNGLLEYVKDFANKNDYAVDVANDIRPAHETISLEELREFVKSLDIHTRGNPIDLRDYQIDAIHKALNREKLLALSPTSSGKSAIIYTAIRHHLEHNRRIILVVPTTSLVNQMFSDFEDYSSANGWDVDANCHMLYSGKIKVFDKPVLITTWQTIHSISKSKSKEISDFYASWDVYIGDEAHRFASDSLQKISNRMINARYRLGTTGTIQDEKVSKLILEGSFGPVYRVITTKQLMDQNQVVNLKIKCITLKYDEETCKLMKNADYQQELDYLVTNAKRNTFIAKLAKATKGNTLILFQFVEKQGKPLYRELQDICEDRKVFYISGETKTDERESIRHEMENVTDAIIVASYQTTSTGINIPSIENVIFASPSKSKIRNLQSIGRGLRLRAGKDSCTLYDISDDMSHRKHINSTLKHYQERIKIYAEEEFEFSLVTVNFSSH